VIKEKLCGVEHMPKIYKPLSMFPSAKREITIIVKFYVIKFQVKKLALCQCSEPT
jgi:hypothetical protein